MKDNRRKKRTDRRRAAVKYAVLFALTLLLHRAVADYALAERGYRAVGGEALLLLLPVLYYIFERMIRDVIEDVRAACGGR